jgi:hypothetical protein
MAMSKTFLCALGLHLAMLPCVADVIPTRHAESDAKARQAVQERLQELGLSVTRANTHAGELTSDEAAYFAHDSARLQPAGALYWYEWLFGAAMLGACIGATAWIYMEHSEHNEHEHD